MPAKSHVPAKTKHDPKYSPPRQAPRQEFTFTMATPTPMQLRSIYRAFLRELPSRSMARSPLQARIRKTIASESHTPIEQADQFLQYVKAQRMYATLLERYNPGMNMDEEERVKLTARRVGMDLPEEFSYAGTVEESGEGTGKK